MRMVLGLACSIYPALSGGIPGQTRVCTRLALPPPAGSLHPGTDAIVTDTRTHSHQLKSRSLPWDAWEGAPAGRLLGTGGVTMRRVGGPPVG